MIYNLQNRHNDTKRTVQRFLQKKLKFCSSQPKYVVQDKMQHSITECCISEKQQARKAEQNKEVEDMLRLTVSPEEYLMINDNIKIVFLGGTKNHLRIMIDAPKEVNIVRSTVLENKITDPEERAKLPKYYAEEEHPEKYRKKSNVIITRGNADKH